MNNIEKIREWQKYHPKKKVNNRNKKLKLEAFRIYSNGKMLCSCCGERHIEFLSIDHIKCKENENRKLLRGPKLYSWLHKNNYPKGFRVLCFNCNLSRGFFGYCPHNKEKKYKPLKYQENFNKLYHQINNLYKLASHLKPLI
jgi:hypothetical protein